MEITKKENSRYPRRDFLRRGAKFVSLLAGLIAIPVVLRQIIPRRTSEGMKFKIGYPIDYPINRFSFNSEFNIYILRDHEGIRILSARCTHLGCIIEKSENGFICPCHGSCYDDEGRVLSGAAPVDLPWLNSYLSADGKIVVEPGKYISADQKLFVT